MKIKHVSSIDLIRLIYDYNNYNWKLQLEDRTVESPFKGFHYFSPYVVTTGNKDDKSENYLVAFNSDNDIVGVLCYGTYGYSEKYQGLSYIDIKRGYKGLGIATCLIKRLNKYLDKSDKLYVSYLSEEGKACKIDKILTKHIDKEIVMDNIR